MTGQDDDELDWQELFDTFSDLVGGVAEPIDIRGGRKPSPEELALDEAEEVVREAIMLSLDDMPARLPTRAAEARLRTKQRELARDAVTLSADCAMAHVLLGDLATSRPESETHYRAGIAAGKRALGSIVLERHAGQIGRIPEARGYLMSHRGLLQCLVDMGRHDEALAECELLAHLDERDTIIARFIHLDLLITLGRFDEARRLCDRYREEAYSGWPYFRALIAFGDTGDSPAARKLLAEAIDANPHVPRLMLSGEQVEPAELLVDVGGEDEAALYVRDSRASWLDVPGALAWLRAATDSAHEKPDRRRPAPRSKDLDSLAGLPQDDAEEWQIDLHREGRDGWLFQVISATDGHMLAIDMQRHRPRGDDLWGLLSDVMRRPRAGDPRRPGRIAMRSGVFPKGWSRRFERLGIKQDLRDSLEELDRAVADVTAGMAAAEAAREMESLPDYDPLTAAAELADLPLDPGEVWEVDIRPAPAWVTGEGKPYRPWLTFVASRTRDQVLLPDMATEQPEAAQLLALIMRAMRQENLRPARVEFIDATLAEPIAKGLEPAGVAVGIASSGLPTIDRMAESLAGAIDEPDTLRPLIGVPGMTDDMLRSLYAAAAAFYRARPWRQIPSDTAIDIRGPGADGRVVYAVVMGQSGVQQGLAIYEDRAALDAVMSGDQEAAAGSTSLAVMFGEAFEIHAADHDRIRQRGFDVAGPEAWPLMIRLNPGFSSRPPLVWEVELITHCLREITDRGR